MADIKLFVCCHQLVEVPRHPLLIPIQVGAALADHRFSGFLHDDTGDNISIKNRSYCELTAQYWAWKNIQADYYGFFHYRRYLYPDKNARRPYKIERRAEHSLLEKLQYRFFENLIQEYDLILPIGENMYLPVREHYARAPFHHKKDLDLVQDIAAERSPEYAQPLMEYLAGTISYFGNIFIMKKDIFYSYCRWLFPILESFEQRCDHTGYSPQEKRAIGYLGERLLGAYAKAQAGDKKMIELPRVHFMGPYGTYLKHKALSVILPPGTARRYYAKKFLRRYGGGKNG